MNNTNHNARQFRQWAILLSIALHIMIGIGLYLSTSSPKKNDSKPAISAAPLAAQP